MAPGTLDIVFTMADMARTTVAAAADPMWETVFSLHRLQTDRGYLEHLDWHHQVRQDLRASKMTPMIRSTLLPLVPLSTYFPDFLTPQPGPDLIEDAIETISATPATCMRRELRTMIDNGDTLPTWTVDLASGRTAARRRLGTALQRYHDIAVRPHWSAITRRVTAQRITVQSGILDGGLAAAFASLPPTMKWQPPVLRVSGYPMNRRLHLRGRGITLIPSYFCWGGPVAYATEIFKPVLVYPAPTEGDAEQGTRSSPGSVAALLGHTRSAILHAVTAGMPTTELARQTETAPATVSHHTAILREAGLLTSHRNGKEIRHMITNLGRQLIHRGAGPQG